MNKPANTHNTRKILAEELDWSESKVARADKVWKEAAPEIIEKIKSEDITINQAYQEIKRKTKEQKREAVRQENRDKIADNAALANPAIKADVKFTTIVIDPPWDWGDEGDNDQLGRAKPDYHTLSIDELMALPVADLSLPDAHIYLWITNRSLPKGFALLDQWGFRYITCLTWIKPSFGMGNYFRGSTEQVLFGVRGSLPLKRNDAGTHFCAPRGPNGHSSKPVEFYDLVESCSHGPYLEMFSRNERPDWSPWGENGSYEHRNALR